MSKSVSGTDLPSCLSSRAGWAALLEASRTYEPHVHQIEPTNRCAYRCVMCPRHTKMTRHQGLMELSLFRRLVDQIAGFSPRVRNKEIELFHFGESLLHPELPEMVRLGAERALKMTLSVNPPHLSPELGEALLAAGAYKIIISLDADDGETYVRIRGAAAKFEKALTNIRGLVALHARMRSSTQILVRTIEMHENRGALADMRRRWEGEGITFETRRFFPWTESELAGLGEYDQYPKNMPCPFPWQYLVVQWDGTVVPCCRDYDAFNVVGNANEQTLVEIWNSPAYLSFRRQHETADFGCNNFCRDCSALYST